MVVAGLAGCGFRPLYAPDDRVDQVQQLASIRVPPIADRRGQLLRNELLDRLTPRGAPAAPAYTLDVRLQERTEDLAVQRDDTATRANLIMTVQFKLTELASDRVVIDGDSESFNSYNISEFEFATLSAETDARRRAARELAQDIATRVALVLEREQTDAAALP